MNFRQLFEKKEKPNDVAIIEFLKDSALPVVIYGVSPDVADQIVKKLKTNQITLSFVVYDEDCPLMTDATVLLKDTEQIHVTTIDKRIAAYNVILGFVKGYLTINSISPKFNNAKSIAYLSEIFDLDTITPSFIDKNIEFLEDFFENLQDQKSKDSFVAYLLSKVRQDMKYLPSVFEKTQYFPQGIFELSDNESYFDGGAFTGDTIAAFLKATGRLYRHIWAVEPDRLNYNQLLHYIEDEKLTNIDLINKGIYSFSGKLPFQETGSMLSMITDNSGNYIEVDTIDHITAGKPVTYIKMDVEGVEPEALKGAEQTIKTFKPMLGISIYHKPQDLIDIPNYIKKIVPDYKFYFRVHKKLAIDTVLYGVPIPAG
jgi:FkbM family methyltransferase